jgi:hypothetical protein
MREETPGSTLLLEFEVMEKVIGCSTVAPDHQIR